jgi:hypothetical protein
MTEVSNPFQKLPKLPSSLPEKVEVAVDEELSAPEIESPPPTVREFCELMKVERFPFVL